MKLNDKQEKSLRKYCDTMLLRMHGDKNLTTLFWYVFSNDSPISDIKIEDRMITAQDELNYVPHETDVDMNKAQVLDWIFECILQSSSNDWAAYLAGNVLFSQVIRQSMDPVTSHNGHDEEGNPVKAMKPEEMEKLWSMKLNNYRGGLELLPNLKALENKLFFGNDALIDEAKNKVGKIVARDVSLADEGVEHQRINRAPKKKVVTSSSNKPKPFGVGDVPDEQL
jgi:hypothetical protein